jgi:DNA-directed RNA polymerase subunit RPC12/RpoP
MIKVGYVFSDTGKVQCPYCTREIDSPATRLIPWEILPCLNCGKDFMLDELQAHKFNAFHFEREKK